MMNLPKLTVITPSLNQAEFIERTILSVLDQGYPDLEYLVFDGGSSDGTLEILKKYSGRLTWVSEPDRGQTAAINKGLKAASGEVVAFLNSDDEFEPGALLKVGRYFAGHPSTAWLTGKCKIIDTQGTETMKLVSLYKLLMLRTRSRTLLKVVNYISQPSTFWRRPVMDEIGLLDEDLHLVMDYDYWLRLCQLYPVTFLDENLARFRTYPASKTRKSAELQFDEEYRVVQKYSRSRPLLFAHHLHRVLNVAAYARFIRTR